MAMKATSPLRKLAPNIHTRIKSSSLQGGSAMLNRRIARSLSALVFAAGFSISVHAQSLAEKPPTPPHKPQAAAVESHVKTFDTLDFDVFSNQKWDRLKAIPRTSLSPGPTAMKPKALKSTLRT